MFTLRDFSGGINTTQDPRDINSNEFVYLKGLSVDQNGSLRPQGALIAHAGLFSNKNITRIEGGLQGTAGKNLGYFESDHVVAKKFYTGGQLPSGKSAKQGYAPGAPAGEESSG